VHNQRGELVLDGEHQYLLKTSPKVESNADQTMHEHER